MEDEFKKLTMHESTQLDPVSGNIVSVMRVPGGLLYSFSGTHGVATQFVKYQFDDEINTRQGLRRGN